MKKFLIIGLVFCGFLNSTAQNTSIIRATAPTSTATQTAVTQIIAPDVPNSISFEYDDAGNQVIRKPIYLAARPGRPIAETPDEPKEFIESDIYSDIKYFPNPTVEILYVQWKNQNDWFVNEIKVFSFSGQVMGVLPISQNFEQVEVDFRAYPTGMYELLIVYNNGKQKTLKIIKK